jgi:UDP:flavonoid glycosyltransferase YjiC (YdhE family)
MASLLLQTGMIPSVARPPIMPAGPTLPRWAPRPVGHLYFRLLDVVGYMLVGRRLRILRKKLGLGPLRRFFRWWLSPDLVIGMFPDWYGQPQADWPPQMRLASFPLYDGIAAASLDPAVQQFCEAGEPPIAFTFGTGMMHASKAYRAAADACALLDARGIFLTKYPEQLPNPLSPSLRHVPFAPFAQLFPRCAAVVHHGGIGTAAQAIRAGVPQLVVPHAWDQFDNAVRLKELGAGDWIKPRHRTAERIAKALRELLRPDVRVQCQALGRRLEDKRGLEVAGDRIEQLFRESTARSARPSARGRAVSPTE